MTGGQAIMETLQEWWAALGAAVGVVFWGARLEQRANQNTRDLANLERRLSEQRKEDMEARARDWGRMETAIGEMRADIKELLKRNAS